MAEVGLPLEIAIPSSDKLSMTDCRRLTGPGLLWERAGAVVDVAFRGIDAARAVALWQVQARRLLDAVGWAGETSTSRRFDGGANLAISAPMDQLYAATLVAQAIWQVCAHALLELPQPDQTALILQLKRAMADEADPALVALLDAAAASGIEAMCDDDEISLGHGSGSRTWRVGDLPAPEDIDWAALHNLPVALITGTNGKTTTTRLCAAIARKAGLVVGLTSTDMVKVGDDVLEKGDFSGPGGARTLLRDRRVEAAYLEVARGGILRRGLPVRFAAVAAVLNAAADHLGEYGVITVGDLAQAKFAVQRALAPGGVLVVNADDDFVVAEAAQAAVPLCWFSLDRHAPQIQAAIGDGQACAWLSGGALVYFDGQDETNVINVLQVPVTMAGTARYNIQNALAALCICRAQGIGFAAIRDGLAGFQNNQHDNPGRCNEFSVNGARVFVDFAHNPHSIAAVTSALAKMPSKHRWLMLSHAGDRSNQDIRDLVAGAFAFRPDFALAAELPDYLRGRASGEVSGLIVAACREMGLKPTHIMRAATPLQGAQTIVALLKSGDLALLLVHSDRDAIFRLLGDEV